MSLVQHLAVDMGVPVSKKWESIEVLIQASLKTAQDPDGRSFPAYLGGKSWDEVPAKTSSGKKFHRNVPILSEQQLVDSGTVDPGWDGELMDNVFVFAKKMCTEASYNYACLATKGNFKDSLFMEVSRDTKTCSTSASEL